MADGPDRATFRLPLHSRWWGRRPVKITAALLSVIFLVLFLGAEYILHNAEPILRKRIIETLSDRFDAPVELDRVDISLLKGIGVDGFGLRIPGGAGIVPNAPAKAMLAVDHFAFRTSFKGLLREPTHVANVRVAGVVLRVPPPGERGRILGTKEGLRPADPEHPKTKPKVALVVSELDCRDVKLLIEPSKPGKEPLEFDIASLQLQNVGPNRAARYDASLINAKPVGAIHAVGHVGPWAGSSLAGDPSQTPLDGDYTFEHADLNTIKGLGGILSSTGHFAGVLEKILIDGHTDTPDFSLDISNHPVPLHTDFHAVVDGTSGDTYLQPVRARLAGSDFTTSGKIVKIRGGGHDIQLDVDIPHGRMQDFLRLAAKTNPPLMNGTLTMKARLHVPPGERRVPEKLSMEGTLAIRDVRFNKPAMQDRIDGLSARAQGKPKEVASVSTDHEAEVQSQLGADFNLGRGVMAVTSLHYEVPGATVLLNGVYSLDGKVFEFKGHVRTEATVSQMVTGWKQWLLKPVDPFLRKNGAGLEVPIEISGTEGGVHFGLAMHGTGDTPQQMLTEVRGKEHDQNEMAGARREMALADAEDAQAARATSLGDAERAHAAAVRHRAEARSRAQATGKLPGGHDR